MDKLIVKNLQKSFYSKKEKKYNVVLADLSFSVHPGEFFVLMGESGAGKTTLLRTIAGLEDFGAALLLVVEVEEFDRIHTGQRVN